MLFTVSACAEPEEASAVLHIFTAHDIRKVLQSAPGDQNGKLELPPEQWSRKYSALHPIVPRVFNFEFRSSEHTRSGHVVFRASGSGEGPQYYWNVGQVRWSIEKSENEVLLVSLCLCGSLTGSSSPSKWNHVMNWSLLRKIPVLLLHPSSSRRRRSVEQFTLTNLRTRFLGSSSLLGNVHPSISHSVEFVIQLLSCITTTRTTSRRCRNHRAMFSDPPAGRSARKVCGGRYYL